MSDSYFFQMVPWVYSRLKRDGTLEELIGEKNLTEKEWAVLEVLSEYPAAPHTGHSGYSTKKLGYDTFPILQSLRKKGLLEEWH